MATSSASPDRPPGRPGAGPRPRGGLWRSTLALRLTLGYAALFALSALVLFALTFALLLGFLQGQDRAFARGELRAYAEAYARGGLPAVGRAAGAIREDDEGEEMLVRVADAAGRTRLLYLPEDWLPADLAPLARAPIAPGQHLDLPNPRRAGEEVEVFAYRLADGTVIQVGMSSDERNDVAESFPDVFLAISLPLLLAALGGGAFMAQRAVRPVRHLVGTLRAIIETGDVRQRAPDPGARGELAELFLLFNRMLDRIEALVERLRGTLDDVAHDLRTPLTRLRGAAELALRHDEPARLREALADAVEAADAVAATLAAITDVAEAEAGAVELRLARVRLGALARDVVDLYGPVAEEKGVALAVEPGAEAEAVVDPDRIRRALANLVDNAVKYTPPGGRVAVRVGRDAGGPRLAVEDTGPGIPPEELPRIWDRLYRGDRSRSERGLGLGLSLVRGLVEAHGGRVEAESEPGVGSTFTLHLPPPPEPGGRDP